jgi:hypothetical protein
MSINDQLERILSTPPLVSSPSLSRFLRYVVEETVSGRSGAIKEYTLGLNVFDRGEEFNPRLDPIVRVQARNLRSRLEKYYRTQGVEDPIRIELPKGTYVPVFHYRTDGTVSGNGTPAEHTEAPRAESAAAPAAAGSVMPAPPPRSPVDENRKGTPRFMLAALILAVVLVGIAAFFAGQTQAQRAKAHQSAGLRQAELAMPASVHSGPAPVILRG